MEHIDLGLSFCLSTTLGPFNIISGSGKPITMIQGGAVDRSFSVAHDSTIVIESEGPNDCLSSAIKLNIGYSSVVVTLCD